jgi:ferrous iron transport protein B
MPTARTTLKHAWDKGEQYLKKMGGVILVASIVIWFLSYYPVTGADDAAVDAPARTEQAVAGQAVADDDGAQEEDALQYGQSYLGRLGRFFEPVMKPLGLDWKASVAILTGLAAKEVVVSTLGVLYSDGNEATLSGTLLASGDFTPRSALAFMIFVLIYVPCIAALAAIGQEAGSKKWALFAVVFNTTLAWLVALAVYTVSGFF